VRSDHTQLVATFHSKKKEEQNAINQYQRQLEEKNQLVLGERANNVIAINKLRTSRLQMENQRALIRRDREKVQLQQKELLAREEESKRNRHGCHPQLYGR
jgi:hypothetical protein